MSFLNKYYPIVLAIFALIYSVFLWFSGSKLEGLYVGLWPVTILAFTLVLSQIQNQNNSSK